MEHLRHLRPASGMDGCITCFGTLNGLSTVFPSYIPDLAEWWGIFRPSTHSDSGTHTPPHTHTPLPVSLEGICSFVGGATGLPPLLPLFLGLREKNSGLHHPQWFLPTMATNEISNLVLSELSPAASPGREAPTSPRDGWLWIEDHGVSWLITTDTKCLA